MRQRACTALGLVLGLATTLLAGCGIQGSPTDLVNSLETASGRHDTYRRAHAKGLCATGEWQATGAGARLSVAPDLAAGFRAPVVARFSMASGNPNESDSGSVVRGLAVAMSLGDERHEFVMLSVPTFNARTPADFSQGLQTLRPDPATGRPDPQRIAAYNATHPEAVAALEALRRMSPSTSYATAPYYGIHTFFLVDAAGTRTPVRWRFEPVAGRQGLTPEQRQTAGRDYLAPELRARLARGPAEWRVFVALGAPGDSLTDPTQPWPEDRPQVEVARLRISAVQPPDGRGACDPQLFSPLVLPRGIAPSDDPVLLARDVAYRISQERRLR